MKRALLVIDVQNEYFTGKLPVRYPVNSFANILKVMDIANEEKIPVLLIRHTARKHDSPTFRKGTLEWEIHPEVMKRNYNALVDKHLPGSFTDTFLEEWLKENSIDTVAICGYMTQMCCDTTARQAIHRGFAVEFISDATGTLDLSNYAGTIRAEDLFRATLITQAARISAVMTANEWIDLIQG